MHAARSARSMSWSLPPTFARKRSTSTVYARSSPTVLAGFGQALVVGCGRRAGRVLVSAGRRAWTQTRWVFTMLALPYGGRREMAVLAVECS